MCASVLLQVKLRLQTHYQNIESLVSIYEDVIVKVGDLSPSYLERSALLVSSRPICYSTLRCLYSVEFTTSQINLKSGKRVYESKVTNILLFSYLDGVALVIIKFLVST